MRLPCLPPTAGVRIATTRAELCRAFELVYDRYLHNGYVKPHPGRIVYHEVFSLPSSRTLIAADRSGEVLGTLTVVGDNPFGLQAETTYPLEIQSLRAKGRRLAEITCLAIRDQVSLLSTAVFFALTKLMIHHVYREGYDDLVMAIHPRHYRFYWRYFRVFPLGPQRPHEPANGNPAVCHRIDLRTFRRNVVPELWDQYFSEPVPESELDRPPIRPIDHLYFCRLSGLVAGSTDVDWSGHSSWHDKRA